jgi:hypothetical protein
MATATTTPPFDPRAAVFPTSPSRRTAVSPIAVLIGRLRSRSETAFGVQKGSVWLWCRSSW